MKTYEDTFYPKEYTEHEQQLMDAALNEGYSEGFEDGASDAEARLRELQEVDAHYLTALCYPAMGGGMWCRVCRALVWNIKEHKTFCWWPLWAAALLRSARWYAA